MKAQVRAAFDAVCDGFSPDRVVADPVLNALFQAECQRLGLTQDPADLNRGLLNLRKLGKFSGRPRSRRTLLGDDGEYRFACEIAARFLERRDGISLDSIICDPITATEFDRLAAQLAPGYAPLQYRWAALRLRKTRLLPPELMSHAVPSSQVSVYRIAEVDLTLVPALPGLYIYYVATQALYVGEAHNLRLRIKKHLDHSDNKGLARWMWDKGTDDIFLELHVLYDSVSTRTRRALEAELIASRRPLFNVQSR